MYGLFHQTKYKLIFYNFEFLVDHFMWPFISIKENLQEKISFNGYKHAMNHINSSFRCIFITLYLNKYETLLTFNQNRNFHSHSFWLNNKYQRKYIYRHKYSLIGLNCVRPILKTHFNWSIIGLSDPSIKLKDI